VVVVFLFLVGDTGSLLDEDLLIEVEVELEVKTDDCDDVGTIDLEEDEDNNDDTEEEEEDVADIAITVVGDNGPRSRFGIIELFESKIVVPFSAFLLFLLTVELTLGLFAEASFLTRFPDFVAGKRLSNFN